MTRIPRSRGFSLIELMMVVVIIGILAAIAFPSYRTYVQRGYTAAVQGFMLNVAQRQEQYLLDARQYAVITSNAEFTSILNMSVPTEVSKYYTVTAGNVAGNTRTYLITALPIAGAGASSTTYTLDNLGTKAPAGSW